MCEIIRGRVKVQRTEKLKTIQSSRKKSLLQGRFVNKDV